MISFPLPQISTILALLAISLLSACGGGGGGDSTSGGGGFTTDNTNTKPQTSSTESSASSSTNSSSSSANLSRSSGTSASKVTIDISAPTLPSDPYVAFIDHDIIMLSWAAASDNVGATRYKIYRNQVQIDEVDSREPFYDDFSVAPSSNYIYSISAGDAAGNWSPLKSIFAKTPERPLTIPTASSSSSSSSSSSFGSSKSASSASNSSSNTSSAAPLISVHLEWNRPIYRENGSDLFDYEIARYELRYTLTNNLEVKTYSIEPPLTSITLSEIPSNTLFEIRAVDTNNRYSRYAQIFPR